MDDKQPDFSGDQSGSIFEQPQYDVPQNLDSPPSASGGTQQPGIDAGDAFLNAPPPDYGGGAPVYEESKSKYYIIIGAIVFFVLIFAGVLFFLFTRTGAGGSQAEAEPQPVTLTYWGLWEDEAVMAPLIQEYQQANPHVTIEYEKMDPERYRTLLIERSENGVGPDIFRFHNTWLPQISEVAAPIPPEILSPEEFQKTFYPVHAKDLGHQGSYFGIPLFIDGLVLVYNESLFQKAGITGPPTSWLGDLPEVVSELTVQDTDGNIVTSGIAMGTATNVEHFAEIYGLLLLQNNGSIENLDSQAAAEALQVYRDFAEEGIWDEAMPNSIEAFIQERVAMIIVPSWQVIPIISSNPDLSVRVAQVPRGLNNEALSLANYWAEGVSSYSPNLNQVEAWKFLVFLSSKESQQKLFAQQSKLRPFGAAYSRVDLSEELRDHPYLGPVVQQGDYYESIPVVKRTFDEGLNDGIVQYLENAINETAQGVSYQGALETAHNGVVQVLSRFEYELYQEDETGTAASAETEQAPAQ